jgi:hypothetical protein
MILHVDISESATRVAQATRQVRVDELQDQELRNAPTGPRGFPPEHLACWLVRGPDSEDGAARHQGLELLDRPCPQAGDLQYADGYEQSTPGDHQGSVVAFDHGEGRHGALKS